MVLRQFEAATVVGAIVGATVGRGLYVVGFIVGDGRGRGRGLGLEPAASLPCHSNANSSVRGSILTFGERLARSKSALVLLCDSVTSSRARLWPRLARDDATFDAILQRTRRSDAWSRLGCAGRPFMLSLCAESLQTGSGTRPTHSSIRAHGWLIPRSLVPRLARRGSCGRPTSPAAAR